MSDEIVAGIHVDVRIDSYRSFFSDDWGQRIDRLTSASPKLSALILRIMLEWRATAYTASLPVAILDHMKAYHDGFVNTGEINTTLLRLATTVTPILAKRIPELTTDPSLISRLQTEIVKIGAELEDAHKATKVEFSLEENWQEYLKNPVYQLSLWGSQQHAYVSIYNSYETFLVRMLCVAQQIESCRTTDADFKKRFADSFGTKLKAKCWTDNELNIARLARHSLSHAGGRVTKQLAKHGDKHGFEILDERIHVTPDKTKALFALLKDCVYALAEKAIEMPQFK